MRRLMLGASVIGLALTVTSAALADDDKPVVTSVMAAVSAPSAPVMAAVSAPSAPVMAAVSAPSAPLTASVSAPSAAGPAPIAAPTPPAAAPAAVAPAKEIGAPLVLRSVPAPAPLSLAPEAPSTSWIYKLAFAAAIVAAGYILWKRRRTADPKGGAATAIRVLGKTAMGLRGELALIEVGGMRLVVGITPSSMQTLAVLPDEGDMTEVAAEPPAKDDLATRARSLFSSLDMGPPVPARARSGAFSASRYADERDNEEAPDSAPAPKTRSRESEASREDGRRRPSAVREIPLEGQARGIALALRKKK